MSCIVLYFVSNGLNSWLFVGNFDGSFLVVFATIWVLRADLGATLLWEKVINIMSRQRGFEFFAPPTTDPARLMDFRVLGRSSR